MGIPASHSDYSTIVFGTNEERESLSTEAIATRNFRKQASVCVVALNLYNGASDVHAFQWKIEKSFSSARPIWIPQICKLWFRRTSSLA